MTGKCRDSARTAFRNGAAMARCSPCGVNREDPSVGAQCGDGELFPARPTELRGDGSFGFGVLFGTRHVRGGGRAVVGPR